MREHSSMTWLIFNSLPCPTCSLFLMSSTFNSMRINIQNVSRVGHTWPSMALHKMWVGRKAQGFEIDVEMNALLVSGWDSWACWSKCREGKKWEWRGSGKTHLVMVFQGEIRSYWVSMKLYMMNQTLSVYRSAVKSIKLCCVAIYGAEPQMAREKGN